MDIMMFRTRINAPQGTTHGRPLHVFLVALVVAALIPAVGTAAFALWQTGGSYRKASESRLADTARTLARAIESNLATKAVLLQTVAASVSTDGIELSQAQRWLDQVGPNQGQLALSTGAPNIAATATSMPDAPTTIIGDAPRQGGVSLSNLFIPAGAAASRLAMSVPLSASASGLKPGVLSLVLQPGQLIRLAPQQGSTDASLLIAVTDGTGHIIARSRDSERFVGRLVPDWQRLTELGTLRGQFEARTAEGPGVIFTFETLAGTPGWVVVVGEPLVTFNNRWREPLERLAAGSGIGLLFALLIAGWLARSIVRPVQALARNAQAVASAEGDTVSPAAPVAAAASPIAEFESMRRSIESAQLTLQRRAQAERENAQALAASELRYRTLAETGAVVLWRGSAEGSLMSADGWELLTGEPDSHALGAGWRKRVHPDDASLVDAALAEVAGGALQLDVEFRVAGKDGAWRWLRGRGAAVRFADGPVDEWVGVLEDVDERRRAQARIVHMAHHDALTGLPNRIEFKNRLEAAIQRVGRGENSAVLYIDLDRFKEVNDTFGHPVGDALLRAVTERLLSLVRESDTAARLAGDEFAIVQSRLTTPGDAADLASRIVKAVSEPYALAGHSVTIGASIGIMLISNASDDADRLLKFADMALYRAKQDGRGRHSFFDPEMDVRMQERRRSETELREAMRRKDFELTYQPLINVQFKTMSGVAAALHWNHPARGAVPAADFSALAEDLGLNGQLIEWMLDRVCTDLAGWPECPKGAVNVSAALPRHASALFNWVEQALQRSGLAPHRLELEIEEQVLLEDPGSTMHALHALKTLGVRIAMARFGSGRSALGCLRSFPFDMVKIERSVVRDIGLHKEGDAIVRAVASLCDNLGIMTGAEGVDNEAQFTLLSAEACTEVQGALFGGFLTAAEISEATKAVDFHAHLIHLSTER